MHHYPLNIKRNSLQGSFLFTLEEQVALRPDARGMLLGKEVWSQRENESSGSSRNGLNQVATTLQNGDPSTQSFLQHSVFNGEGRQSQVALKVAVLRKQ